MSGRILGLKGRCRRGMTLIELMIAMSISSVMAVGAVTSMVIVQRGAIEAFWLHESHRESRMISDLIARDIRGAVGLDSDFNSFTTGAGTIILRMPSINSDGDIIDIENDFDRVVYYPKTGEISVLVREVIPGPGSSRSSTTDVIGNIVTGRDFHGTFATMPDALGAFVVHYQFTASRTLGDKTFEVPVSGSVRLRNMQ